MTFAPQPDHEDAALEDPRAPAEQRLYENVFEEAPVALILLTDDRTIVGASRAARRLLDLAPDQIGSFRLDDATPMLVPGRMDALWRLLKSRGEIAARLPMRTGETGSLPLYVRANVLPGRHLGMLSRTGGGPDPADLDPGPGPSLSAREREILTGLAAGERTEQVAERLVLSADTVRTHVRNAMRKLGANSRVHAVVLALRSGEIDP
jgi:DNA-binding CsgD family transcriptional regulator